MCDHAFKTPECVLLKCVTCMCNLCDFYKIATKFNKFSFNFLNFCTTVRQPALESFGRTSTMTAVELSKNGV